MYEMPEAQQSCNNSWNVPGLWVHGHGIFYNTLRKWDTRHTGEPVLQRGVDTIGKIFWNLASTISRELKEVKASWMSKMEGSSNQPIRNTRT